MEKKENTKRPIHWCFLSFIYKSFDEEKEWHRLEMLLPHVFSLWIDLAFVVGILGHHQCHHTFCAKASFYYISAKRFAYMFVCHIGTLYVHWKWKNYIGILLLYCLIWKQEIWSRGSTLILEMQFLGHINIIIYW